MPFLLLTKVKQGVPDEEVLETLAQDVTDDCYCLVAFSKFETRSLKHLINKMVCVQRGHIKCCCAGNMGMVQVPHMKFYTMLYAIN